mgnify:CR=1 FL=1
MIPGFFLQAIKIVVLSKVNLTIILLMISYLEKDIYNILINSPIFVLIFYGIDGTHASKGCNFM